MKKLRQLLIFGLCLLTTVTLLSACTSHPKSAASSRVTITFWHGMTGPRKTALNKMIRDFNQSQSKYKVIGHSQGNSTALQQKITAAAKSKTLPTIAQTAYTNTPDYVKGGFVTSFDPYINKTELSDIYPAFLQSSKYRASIKENTTQCPFLSQYAFYSITKICSSKKASAYLKLGWVSKN